MKLVKVTGVLVVFTFFAAWIMMGTIGIVHHHWWSAVPTIGYRAAVMIMVMWEILGIIAGLCKWQMQEFLK